MEKLEPSGDDSGPALPRGRHGLPRALIIQNQRERLIEGVIEAVAKHGYGATTIRQITEAAKLSRRTFYEQFSNKEACFTAAYEASLERIRAAALGAAEEEDGEWPKRVRAGLAGLLDCLAENPDLATFFLIAPVSANDEIADRHHLAMRELVGGLIKNPPPSPENVEPSATREDALAGGLARLIVRTINAGEAAKLEDLLPSVVELVLRPFLGSEEAVRVATEGE
jgi:AcrR family transcriptional regulator